MANRILCLASYIHGPLPQFQSQAKDVVDLRRALNALKQGKKEFYISEGGTTLRFLLPRLSRENGEFKIYASKRLLERPHHELLQALEKLGTKIIIQSDHIQLSSRGWVKPDERIEIDCSQSTQFISGIILNSINLNFDLSLKALKLEKSLPYWQMSVDLLKKSEIELVETQEEIKIQAGQNLGALPSCEPDMSTAFSLASVGAAGKGIEFEFFPKASLQGDFGFLDLLKQMGVQIQWTLKGLKVFSCQHFKNLEVNLSQMPDLLPVLSALCALCPEESILKELEHTRVKECDRVMKSKELVEKMGGQAHYREGNLHIKGGDQNLKQSFSFDPDHDHRMAMAASVAMARGYSIDLKEPQVVEKSCPEFWDQIGMKP